MQELKSTESDFTLSHEQIGVIFKEMIQMSLWYIDRLYHPTFSTY